MSDSLVVPAQPDTPAIVLENDMRASVRSMQGELDTLQATVLAQKRIWYRDASTIIAILALVFSFGTTYVSYHRTELQDIQSERQELRVLLQRLAALPKENLDTAKRYQGDPAAINLAGSYVNQENAMLSRQAAEIAKKLPKGVVSATEYYAIAVALQFSYNLEGTREFLELAAQHANNFNDEIAAIRSIANLTFITGHSDEGRVKYQEALGIFSKYPGYDQFTQASTGVTTETAWAAAEATIGNFVAANQHLDNADHLVATLANSQGAQALKLQVTQLRQAIQQGMPTSTMPQLQPTLSPPKN